MKRLYLMAVIAITVWQIRAGISRCGTIDGGVLLAPLVIAVMYLVRGMAQDMREVFGTPERGDKLVTETKRRCPKCGATLELTVDWVGGRGYVTSLACPHRHDVDVNTWCGYAEEAS